jgi:hypothetical protein
MLIVDHLVRYYLYGVSNLAYRSLYDMDIVFDPPGSGLFSEVYLYEELMEADLHAIVSLKPFAADDRSALASHYLTHTSSLSFTKLSAVLR